MNKGLNGIKNIIWLGAIMVALVALLVGLIFALSNKYYGDEQDGTLNIKGETLSAPAPSAAAQPVSGSVSALPNSQDAGVEYVFNLTFLCDSSIKALNDYGLSYGGSVSAQMWTDSGSGLSAASASTTTIVSPSDGSQITPVNAAMVYQPKRLVIYLGGDALASADEQTFVSGYTQLITDLRNASPDTTIVCCSVGSIAVSYTGTDGLTAEKFTQANSWIASVCANTGTYYADLASVLNDATGYLKAEYAAQDGRSLNSAGINELINYFRFHAGF